MNPCRSWLMAAALAIAIPSLGAAADAPKAQSTTLESTTIEGQILFPKVLFISSEDPARYPEILHRSYLLTALDLGRSARIPKHIEVGTIVAPVSSLVTSESAPPDAPEPAIPSPKDPEVHP